MLNTSFGKGWAYYLMFDEVDGVTQAAAAALPFQFEAGTQRVRVNPADGQIYLTGLTGWDDGSPRVMLTSTASGTQVARGNT